MQKWRQRLRETEEGRKMLEQERVLMEATEGMCLLMDPSVGSPGIRWVRWPPRFPVAKRSWWEAAGIPANRALPRFQFTYFPKWNDAMN